MTWKMPFTPRRKRIPIRTYPPAVKAHSRPKTREFTAVVVVEVCQALVVMAVEVLSAVSREALLFRVLRTQRSFHPSIAACLVMQGHIRLTVAKTQDTLSGKKTWSWQAATLRLARAPIALSITLAMVLSVELLSASSSHPLSKTYRFKSNKSNALTPLKSYAQCRDMPTVPGSKLKSCKTYNGKVVVTKASFT